MSKDEKDEQEGQTELTEEQRIARLEKQAGTNKILLLIIALLMLIVTTITITAFVLILAKIPGKQATQQVGDISSSPAFGDLVKQLENQSSQLSTFSVSLLELEGKVNNSSNATIQTALLGLEKDNQKFLSALRSGVYDLAHMVPGSRTWLEFYSEQIDQSITRSKAREESLKKLQTSEAVSKGDAFFGDDF